MKIPTAALAHYRQHNNHSNANVNSLAGVSVGGGISSSAGLAGGVPIIMEGPEVTFLFQFGSLRDAVCVPASSLTLKSLKDLACEFINTKVSYCFCFQLLCHLQICEVVTW